MVDGRWFDPEAMRRFGGDALRGFRTNINNILGYTADKFDAYRLGKIFERPETQIDMNKYEQTLAQYITELDDATVQMEVEKSRKKEGTENEYENYKELETLNSMTPIWKRDKKKIKDEEYNNFYTEKFRDFENPIKVIHTAVEGQYKYNALLFIPRKPIL